MPPLSILFVDDEPNVLSSLGRLVRTEAWPAHFAATPREALELVRRRNDIGVVVSDFCMPGMTGVEFLGRLKDMRASVVRVLLTAHSDATVLAAAINGGAVFRYVSKPWDNIALLRVLTEAMDQAELYRENRRLRVITRRRNRQLASLAARLEMKVEERTRHLADANGRMREAAVGVVRLLATAADQTDGDLESHGECTARLAVGVGRRLRLGSQELDDLRIAATVHDIGFIGLPRRLLTGAEPASAADRELMQSHAERGARILEPLPFTRGVVTAVRHHHERWDGQGYPSGLKHSDIPQLARILAVADAYVAATRGEEGRPQMSSPAALAELIRGAGRVHDPEAVAKLVEVVEVETRRAAAAAGEPVLAGSRS